MPVQLTLVDIKGVAAFADELQRPADFRVEREHPYIRVIDTETGEAIAGVKKADAVNSMVYRRVIGAPPNADGTPAMVTERPRAIRIEWTPADER